MSRREAGRPGAAGSVPDRVVLGLVGLGMVLAPFGDLPYARRWLGELAVEGAAYPFLAAVLVWIASRTLLRQTVSAPLSGSALSLAGLVAWLALSTAVNLDAILDASFKGRSGLEKAVGQFGLLTVLCLVPVAVYDTGRGARSRLGAVLQALAVVSLVPALAYAALELAGMLGVATGHILETVDRYVRADFIPGQRLRVRSVSAEPAQLAVYLSLVFPVVLAVAVGHVSTRASVAATLLVVALVVTALTTYSRTAYVVLAVEYGLFVAAGFGAVRHRPQRSIRRVVAMTVMVVCVGVYIDRVGAGPYTVSGVARSLTGFVQDEAGVSGSGEFAGSNVLRGFGYRASLSIARDNPVLGVGPGQFAFHLDPSLVETLTRSSDEYVRQEALRLLTDRPGTPWPPVYSLYGRLLAEGGIPAALLWGGVWGLLGFDIIRTLRRATGQGDANVFLGAALLSAAAGMALVGLAHDSFRPPGYWIVLGAGWLYCVHGGPDHVRGEEARAVPRDGGTSGSEAREVRT